MRGNSNKNNAIKKVKFSLIIILIYIIGSHIVVPGVDSVNLIKMLSNSSNLSFGLSMMGISLNNFSLFSLGLAPWMSALVFWRVLMVTKLFNIENFTEKQSFLIKMFVSFTLGTIQCFTIITQIKSLGGGSSLNFYMLCLLLLSGLSVLIWLGEMNAQYGLGGQTIIILVTIARNLIQTVIQQFSAMEVGFLSILKYISILLLIILCFYGIFTFYQGERRLPVKHILLDEKLSKESYIPISTNAAGSMPFMYAFSIMQLPVYFVFLLKEWVQNNKAINTIYNELQLNHILGVTLLMTTIILLTYGFAYVNVDYKTLSEQLKKTGDYFSNVYPGKNTEKYLFNKVTRITTVSALFNALVIGGPMYVAIYFPKISTWVYLIPTFIIVILMMREIRIQFEGYYHRNDYVPIFQLPQDKKKFSSIKISKL